MSGEHCGDCGGTRLIDCECCGSVGFLMCRRAGCEAAHICDTCMGFGYLNCDSCGDNDGTE